MIRIAFCTSVALAMAQAAFGAGLDRSNQDIGVIFSDTLTADFSFGIVQPSVTGTDALGNTYEVGDTYNRASFNSALPIGDKVTLGFVFDQPYGVNTTYNNSPATSTLGGTGADLSSHALSLIARYNITDRISVYGGVRAQQVIGTVALNGTSYARAIAVSGVTRTFNAGLPAGAPALDSSTLGAALTGDAAAAATIDGTYGAGTTATLGGSVTTTAGSFLGTGGYAFDMSPSWGAGYLVGAAYEIPDIAFRASATYFSKVSHTADTTETVLGATTVSTVDYDTPQAVNIDIQTGIAKDTLLMASYRWAEYSKVDVIPTALGSDLVNLDDAHRYTVGIGRRFSDAFSGSITLSYEPEGDFLVSPLGPTNGLWGISIGARYSQPGFDFSGGINYSLLGDAGAEVGGANQATFTDNSAFGIGFKMNFTF